jgi:CPA2 family monovalent cation:H+ antiporter-2
MILGIQTDPILLELVSISFFVIGTAALMKIMRQPVVIGYIIAGILIGPYVLGLAQNQSLTESIGNFGLVLMMFFLGMEINLTQLIKNWRLSVLGTLLQITVSVLACLLIGSFFDWSFIRSLALGFIISLSSTAVVLNILERKHEMGSVHGQNALGILIVQDIMIAPMIIILSLFNSHDFKWTSIITQILGTIVITAVLILIYKYQVKISRLIKRLKPDHELNVFISFAICFGIAASTSVLGLSSGFGAFVAGLCISILKINKVFHDSLHSMKVLFVALFFVSVGLMLDLNFLIDHFKVIALLSTLVLILNTGINAIVVRLFKHSWRDSLLTGAVLAQIGEFSFVLVMIGLTQNILSEYVYNICLCITSVSLLVSPFWIELTKALTKRVLNNKQGGFLI